MWDRHCKTRRWTPSWCEDQLLTQQARIGCLPVPPCYLQSITSQSWTSLGRVCNKTLTLRKAPGIWTKWRLKNHPWVNRLCQLAAREPLEGRVKINYFCHLRSQQAVKRLELSRIQLQWRHWHLWWKSVEFAGKKWWMDDMWIHRLSS